MKKRPPVRKTLHKALLPYKGPFACYLSGGADSASVLFSLLDLNKEVHAYTAAMKGNISRDLIKARELCKSLNVPHTTVWLSSDLEKLKEEIRENFLLMDLKGKVEVEALWVFRKLIDKTKEPVIATGLYAGIYFGLNKHAMIHYKEDMAAYRKKMYAKATSKKSQSAKVEKYARTKGKVLVTPWINDAMYRAFNNTTWYDVNTPKQKQAIRQEFPEYFKRFPIPRAQDMHKGDSKIADTFALLFNDKELNPGGRHKSMVGIYNQMKRETLANVTNGKKTRAIL